MKEKVVKFIKNCFWLSSEEGKNSKEIYAFNTMRFFAFFFIFFNHIDAIFKVSWLQQAKWGVVFFFMISGFLNGYLNKGVEKINLKSVFAYTKKKMAKTYPFLLFIIFTMLPRASLFTAKSGGDFLRFLGKIIPGVTLTSSWINDQNHYFAFFGGIWYMSTFFFLILLTPFLMKIISKTRETKRGVMKLIILSVVMFVLSMVWTQVMKKNSYYYCYIFPPARLFEYVIGLTWGNLMCYFASTRKNKVKKHYNKSIIYTVIEAISIIAVICTMIITTTIPDAKLVGFLSRQSNIYILPTIIMICVFSKQQGFFSYLLSMKPLVLLGRASMYLYLTHQPILYAMCKLAPAAKGWFFGFYILAVCIVISLYLYKNSNKGKKNENSVARVQK